MKDYFKLCVFILLPHVHRNFYHCHMNPPRSAQTGSIDVRVREGSAEKNKNFNYEYVLHLPQGVQLRGDWADPELHDGKVLGTILEVRVGKDSDNYDGTVESWWNDPQANNMLHTTYTSIADRFIDIR